MKTQSYPHGVPKQRAFSLSGLSYYPWIIVAFSAAFLFYKYILQISPSVMAGELMRTFHLGGAGLGNLAATFFYSYLVVQLFSGPLMDRFSPRWLSTFALLLCVVGAGWFSQTQVLWQAEIARACIGAGAAFATVSYLKMAALWFKAERFAFISGLLATAAMAGSMSAQAPFAWLMTHQSWRGALLDCAVVGLVLTVLYGFFVRDKGVAIETLGGSTATVQWRDYGKVLKKPVNWWVMLYSGLAFSPLAVFGGLWGVGFLQADYTVSKTVAASMTSIVFLGLALGGPVLGWLADYSQRRFQVMLLGLGLSILGLASVVYGQLPSWVLMVALFSFGFGTGAFMLGFVVGKDMNAAMMAATVIALINTGDAIFGAFSEPLIGHILDWHWQGHLVNGVRDFGVGDYQLAFGLLVGYLLLALVCLLKLKPVICLSPR